MKGSMLRPLLMVIFVFAMVFLLQKQIEENQQLKEQQTQVDPSSIIYSDMGSGGEVVEEEVIIEDEITPEVKTDAIPDPEITDEVEHQLDENHSSDVSLEGETPKAKTGEEDTE